MALYEYTALSLNGKTKHGKMEASDYKQLNTVLRNTGLYLIKAESSDDKRKNYKRLTASDLAEFCRELGTMLGSGVTLVHAMGIILQRDVKPKLKPVFQDLNTSLKRGITLSDSMAQLGVFPELLINMFKAGEESGKIDKTAIKMSEYYEKENRLQKDIKGAMLYPTILAILTFIVMILIFTVILPRFFSLFKNISLPLPTKIVMAVSGFITHDWLYLIFILGIIFILAYSAYHAQKSRIFIDKSKLSVPKIGKLLKIIYTSRFARTLSSLYSSGLSIISCLNASKNTIGNRYISSQFDDAIKKLRAGNSLAASLDGITGFDKKLISTIMIGEESGRLEDMLNSVAESYEYESKIAINKLLVIIEPVMICIMAAIIAFVMLSVMMPIYQLYTSISNS